MTDATDPREIDLTDAGDDWDAWAPDELAGRLEGVGVPWWVCGGWAVDLFLGRQSREHEDIEFAVCRADFPAVREALWSGGTHEQLYVGSGKGWVLPPGELPPAEYEQVWTRDRASGRFRTDTFLDPGSRDEWVSKRDNRIRLPLAAMIGVSADGIPYQRPEVVLFMKAKHRRAKDEADLATLWPALDADRRRWFTESLMLADPGNAWLDTVGRM